jgi:hypothetical protein
VEYIHETVDSERLLGLFKLPLSLRNQRVEVIIRPIESGSHEHAFGKSAFGCLHRFARPDKIAGEKGAWERAAVEKHAKS